MSHHASNALTSLISLSHNSSPQLVLELIDLLVKILWHNIVRVVMAVFLCSYNQISEELLKASQSIRDETYCMLMWFIPKKFAYKGEWSIWWAPHNNVGFVYLLLVICEVWTRTTTGIVLSSLSYVFSSEY